MLDLHSPCMSMYHVCRVPLEATSGKQGRYIEGSDCPRLEVSEMF